MSGPDPSPIATQWSGLAHSEWIGARGGWSSLYISSNTVVETIAKRLNVDKDAIVGPDQVRLVRVCCLSFFSKNTSSSFLTGCICFTLCSSPKYLSLINFFACLFIHFSVHFFPGDSSLCYFPLGIIHRHLRRTTDRLVTAGERRGAGRHRGVAPHVGGQPAAAQASLVPHCPFLTI